MYIFIANFGKKNETCKKYAEKKTNDRKIPLDVVSPPTFLPLEIAAFEFFATYKSQSVAVCGYPFPAGYRMRVLPSLLNSAP